MVDLSNLKLVEEQIEVTDDSQYVDAREFPPPPPEGLYNFLQGAPTFGATAAGHLQATMDQTIVGGDQDGTKVMFDRVNAKPFERDGVRGCSFMRDHLRAVYPPSSPERSARTNDELATALAGAEGKTFKGKVKWDGYCAHKETEHGDKDAFSVDGQRNFPNGNDVPCPICAKPVRPRAKISLRIAAS